MNRTQTMGAWCVVAAAYLAIGGVATQIVQASTSVSDQVWSYPWSGEASIPLSASWAIAQIVLVLAILELRRTGLAGPTRAASVGLATAAVGTSLIVVGHLVSIAVADQNIHATGPEDRRRHLRCWLGALRRRPPARRTRLGPRTADGTLATIHPLTGVDSGPHRTAVHRTADRLRSLRLGFVASVSRCAAPAPALVPPAPRPQRA